MTDAEQKIAAFLRESHPTASGGIEAILGSKDLFADGWIDSLLHLQLLAFLESSFGLRIPPFQVTRRNFASVSAISELITGRA